MLRCKAMIKDKKHWLMVILPLLFIVWTVASPFLHILCFMRILTH